MADLKAVGIKLVADHGGFMSSMKASSGAVDGFSKGAVVGFAAAGVAGLAFAKSSADAYMSLGKSVMKLSRITGESVETSSKFIYAAKMSGVSADTLAKGMKFLEVAMVKDSDQFKTLGVSVRDSSGHLKSTHSVFLDTADAISKMGSAAERTDMITKVFGARAGLELGSLLSRGKAGIIALEQEAQKYGLVLDAQNVGAIKDNIKAHREQEAAMQGLQVQIGQNVLPVMTAFTTASANLTEALGPTGVKVIGVAAGLGGLIAVGTKAVSVGKSLAGALGGMGSKMGVAGVAAGVAITAYEIWNKRMEEAKEHAEKFGDVVQKALAKRTFEELPGQVTKIRDQITGLGRDIESSKAPWDADYRAELEIYQTQLTKQVGVVEAYQKQIGELATATGMSTDVTKTWVDAEAKAGRTYDDTAAAVVAFTGVVDESTLSEEDAEKAIKAVTEALKKQDDAERALLSPQFAVIDSLNSLKDAQDKAREAVVKETEARKEYERLMSWFGGVTTPQSVAALAELTKAHQETETATRGVASANLDLDNAARNLASAVNTGKVSMSDTIALLQTWKENGRITGDQAATLEGQVRRTVAAFGEFDGTHTAYLRAIFDEGPRKPSGPVTVNGVVYPNGYASGTSSLPEGASIINEQGPELLYKRGGNVSVMTAGRTAQALTAAVGGGKAVTVNVYPSAGMNEKQISDLVVRRIRQAG